jgi:transposase
MAGKGTVVIGGADTHKDLHLVAALTQTGERIGCKAFPTNTKGYKDAIKWLCSLGELTRVGIEGSGSYGAGLCRYVKGANITVLEVTGPDKARRRLAGKYDEEDAYQAAEAALSGVRCKPAKDRTSDVEALRPLRVAYDGAVKARTAALNNLDALVIGAEDNLRRRLRDMGGMTRAKTCASLRVCEKNTSSKAKAEVLAIRSIAKRVISLDQEAKALHSEIEALCKGIAPETMALKGIGAHCASKLLLAAGGNIERMEGEAGFSMLCGASPLKASSGKDNNRHRINHGGDRQANSALYTIVIYRMGKDERTKDYVKRRTAEGKSKKDIIRCLKRYVAREVYNTLKADLSALGVLAGVPACETAA